MKYKLGKATIVYKHEDGIVRRAYVTCAIPGDDADTLKEWLLTQLPTAEFIKCVIEEDIK